MRLLGSFSAAGGSAAGLSTGNNLLHSPAAASTRSAAAITATTARLNTWDTYAATEAPAAAQPAATQLPPVLPNLQPISSVLARQLQREQQQRKRLRKQLYRLESKLFDMSSSSSEACSLSWLGLPDPAADADSADDPLFSSSTPPSVQQLQRLLVHRRSQLLRASSSSISDVARVAAQLQDIASQLDLHINTVILLVARHEPLLLQPAHQLPPRLALLSAALQLHPQAAGDLLSSSAPQLLGTSLRKLQSNVLQLDRIFSSRGIKLAEVLQARPDLLTQNPSSVEGKLEQLPGALGMSRQRVRQLVSQCPDLLRLSVGIVSNRYHSLRQLFSIPDSFVEEFVVQEPELLCMSATTLKAKFDSLLRRYGAFADDVLDMVLVDPALLINADPTAVPPAPTVKASRKKQQKLLFEQQQQQQVLEAQQQPTQPQLQQQQQQQPVVQDALLPALSPGAAPDSAQGAAGNAVEQAVQVEQPYQEAEQQQVMQVQQVQRVEEPWEVVLRLRLERRQAARERRRLRQQERQQQQAEQLRLRAGPMQQQWQQRAPILASSSKRQSPVRRLLAFAAATGLSGEQALQLWQQEPSLSLLPAAAVGRQVAELSRALGLQEGSPAAAAFSSSSSTSGGTQGLLAAAAAGAGQQQQQWQPWKAGVGADAPVANSSGSSSADAVRSRPILQVLVKEPLLLVLSDEQLAENMQGLCNLLGLQVPTVQSPPGGGAAAHEGNLLPLLWEHPGLLLLPPEVGEYRLQHLAGLLQLSVPRALQLVLQQPQLLTERPVLLAARLGSLCTLLGVARGVASECVLREPRVLCVDEAELQGRWEALVGRFGWAPDALDVVMADPAALMRDSLEE